MAEGRISDTFQITTGVLQGDVLAPFLLVIVIAYLLATAMAEYQSGLIRQSSRHSATCISDLDFADEICLLESSIPNAQAQFCTVANLSVSG
jgi:hypothetical protein